MEQFRSQDPSRYGLYKIETAVVSDEMPDKIGTYVVPTDRLREFFAEILDESESVLDIRPFDTKAGAREE